MNEPEPAYVCLDLGGTKTYSRRRAVWLPGPHPEHGERLGTLRITQEKAKGGSECDQYGVEWDSDPAPAGAVALLLANDAPEWGDRQRRAEYRVVIHEEPARCGCGCAGTRTGGAPPGGCKHIAACRELLRKAVRP